VYKSVNEMPNVIVKVPKALLACVVGAAVAQALSSAPASGAKFFC
jgi:hypothetical protein